MGDEGRRCGKRGCGGRRLVRNTRQHREPESAALFVLLSWGELWWDTSVTRAHAPRVAQVMGGKSSKQGGESESAGSIRRKHKKKKPPTTRLVAGLLGPTLQESTGVQSGRQGVRAGRPSLLWASLLQTRIPVRRGTG